MQEETSSCREKEHSTHGIEPTDLVLILSNNTYWPYRMPADQQESLVSVRHCLELMCRDKIINITLYAPTKPTQTYDRPVSSCQDCFGVLWMMYCKTMDD
jgi:hypothetical protein